jgi:predicted GTPase
MARDAQVIQDVYIAVMGVTGAGKSSFISTCSGKSVKIGHNLKSCKEAKQHCKKKYKKSLTQMQAPLMSRT